MAAATALLALAGCGLAAPAPVERMVVLEADGRVVESTRACDRVPVLGTVSCRTETTVRSYCYRSLARVDCYAQPQPGRTAMQTVHD